MGGAYFFSVSIHLWWVGECETKASFAPLVESGTHTRLSLRGRNASTCSVCWSVVPTSSVSLSHFVRTISLSSESFFVCLFVFVVFLSFRRTQRRLPKREREYEIFRKENSTREREREREREFSFFFLPRTGRSRRSNAEREREREKERKRDIFLFFGNRTIESIEKIERGKREIERFDTRYIETRVER